MTDEQTLALAERHADTDRNRILNIALMDLDRIINGHDPEVDTSINNMVWDRLDKMAIEIESLAHCRAPAADNDATIARMTAELEELTGNNIVNKTALRLQKAARARAEAALEQSRDAGFREGVEAAGRCIDGYILAYTARDELEGTLRVVRDAVSRLAPQAVDVRDTPTQAQQAGLSDAGAPQADPVREPTEAMLEAAADWSRCKYGIPIGNDAAIGCWQAMYDALAGEQP